MSASHRRSVRATAARLAASGRSRSGRAAGRVRRTPPVASGGRPAGPRVPRGGRRPGSRRSPATAATAAAATTGASAGRGSRAAGPRRPGLTTRAAVLALVICGVVLGLAYPMRTHLAQRAAIAELEAEAEQRAERVAVLEADLARWDDPAHVEAEARRRLGYVHPGETLYTVLDPSARAEEVEPATPSGVPPLREQAPWWGQLWHSAQGSDAAPVPPGAPAR